MSSKCRKTSDNITWCAKYYSPEHQIFLILFTYMSGVVYHYYGTIQSSYHCFTMYTCARTHFTHQIFSHLISIRLTFQIKCITLYSGAEDLFLFFLHVFDFSLYNRVLNIDNKLQFVDACVQKYTCEKSQRQKQYNLMYNN